MSAGNVVWCCHVRQPNHAGRQLQPLQVWCSTFHVGAGWQQVLEEDMIYGCFPIVKQVCAPTLVCVACFVVVPERMGKHMLVDAWIISTTCQHAASDRSYPAG